MGMSKEQKALYAKLTSMIDQMSRPQSNPAQNYLTNEALAGANWLKAGDYSSLPKGMFFNFEMPQEQLDRYKKAANVSQGGTFALAANAPGGDVNGRTSATNLQGKYLQDKFARDSGLNYQNNVANAAQNVYGALGQSANATSQNQANVVNALQGAFSSLPQHQSVWGSILGAVGGLGSAAISKW